AFITACATARPSNFATASGPTPEPAHDSTHAESARDADVRPEAHRFYTGKTYGTEAEFNPVTEVLNEGFDVLGTRGQDRHIFRRDLGGDARNVLSSALNPIHTFSSYGWRYVLR